MTEHKPVRRQETGGSKGQLEGSIVKSQWQSRRVRGGAKRGRILSSLRPFLTSFLKA